jgi:hypothetical protein
MSKLGIGLFYFALAGAVAAAIFGFMLVQKYNGSLVTINETKQSLTVAKSETKKAKEATDAANKARDEATTELTESKGKVDDLNTKLTAAQTAQDGLKTQLQTAQDDADKAKKDYQHVKDVLGDMSPEDMKAALTKAQSDVAAAQGQVKIVQDKFQAQDKQIADLHDAINRVGKPNAMPPGISGKITFVNRAWNFVVLNVGLSNGVVPNGELIVYRGRNFLGKIKVTSAEDGTAVADILPNAKADIQVGDDVLN